VRRRFELGHGEFVLVRDIELWSLCEHHLVPFTGVAHVGYIPSEDGRTVGLSKLARLVDLRAKRPQVQERLTIEVADALEALLRPRGTVVVIEAEHLCMTMRGVRKAGASTITSSVRGILRTDPAARRGDVAHPRAPLVGVAPMTAARLPASRPPDVPARSEASTVGGIVERLQAARRKTAALVDEIVVIGCDSTDGLDRVGLPRARRSRAAAGSAGRHGGLARCRRHRVGGSGRRGHPQQELLDLGMMATQILAAMMRRRSGLDATYPSGEDVKLEQHRPCESLELTRRLNEMVATGRPVLVSLSDKDFIGETLGRPVGERLVRTLAAIAVCALHGARIYHVHQVMETKQTLDTVWSIADKGAPAGHPGAAVTRIATELRARRTRHDGSVQQSYGVMRWQRDVPVGKPGPCAV
jgi:GTP cyclohydrolase I